MTTSFHHQFVSALVGQPDKGVSLIFCLRRHRLLFMPNPYRCSRVERRARATSVPAFCYPRSKNLPDISLHTQPKVTTLVPSSWRSSSLWLRLGVPGNSSHNHSSCNTVVLLCWAYILGLPIAGELGC